MAVEVLVAYLTLNFPGEVILIQYVDDVLLASADASRLHAKTTMLMAKMRTARWIISAKSQVEPTTQLTWTGKHLNGQRYTLMHLPEYMDGHGHVGQASHKRLRLANHASPLR